jgi:hypothetical protein
MRRRGFIAGLAGVTAWPLARRTIASACRIAKRASNPREGLKIGGYEINHHRRRPELSPGSCESCESCRNRLRRSLVLTTSCVI